MRYPRDGNTVDREQRNYTAAHIYKSSEMLEMRYGRGNYITLDE